MGSNIFLVVLVCLLFAGKGLAEDKKLCYAFSLINAGSSSPAFPIPTMNWEDWPERAPFYLSGIGMREQYLLGKELRRRYDEAQLLDQSMLIDQVMIRILDQNNTIESGLAFIRGFYNENLDKLTPEEQKVALPPMTVEKYYIDNIKDNVLPFGIGTIPFHTHFPRENDVFAPCFCPNANNDTFIQFNTSTHVAKLREQFERVFIDIVKKHYNVCPNVTKFPAYVPLLFSIYQTNKLYRDTLLNEEEVKNVTTYAERLSFHFLSGKLSASQMRSYPILSLMQHTIEESIKALTENQNRQNLTKAAFVFMEDRLMTSLLSVLGKNISTPMQSSSLISFEIAGDKPYKTEDMIVSFKYNDEPIKFFDCPEPCPYKKFIEILTTNVPKKDETEFKAECTQKKQ